MHGIKKSLPDTQKSKDTSSFMGTWQLSLLSMMNLASGMDVSNKATRQSENTPPGLANQSPSHGNDVGNTEDGVASSKDEGGDDLEDEWYDTTTSEECTPVKNNAASGAEPSSPSDRYQQRTFQTVEDAEVPSLFDTTLPPCNADVQLAYQYVNSRLRTRWAEMHNTGSLASTRAPLVAVCRSVSRELKHHDRERQKSKKENKYVRPYYRPSVFHYQLCWIDYFIREAKAMVPVLLTESEMLDKKAKMPDVPPELQFEALPRSVPPYVVTLWREWNEKKRAGTPASGLAVPEVQNGAPGGLRGGGVMSPIAETKTDNENKDGDLSLSQDTTPVATPTPTPGGSSESDAHFWSEGGHD